VNGGLGRGECVEACGCQGVERAFAGGGGHDEGIIYSNSNSKKYVKRAKLVKSRNP